MDKAVSIVTGLMMSGLLVFMAWMVSGGFPFNESPRNLSYALSVMGGPLGFWGGTGLVVASGLAAYFLQEMCNYWLGLSVVRGLEAHGNSYETLAAKLDSMPISAGLKRRLKAAAKHPPGHPPTK
jgi:hypothetical protein